MAKKIDHEKRKREIAEKSLQLFSQVGYDNVSLIMISAACGVSRTAIYQYFCTKREVMDAAIRFVTDEIAAECTGILSARGSCVEKLIGVCHSVTDVMYRNQRFLIAVFDFVTGMVRTGADMNATIGHFTAGTREAISRLIELGKKRGEFSEKLVAARGTDVLYSEFESCAMRIALGSETDSKAAKTRFADIIAAIAAWGTERACK